ncbi:V-set and immunoglobulin domain-containing protein 2-like isoform X2 [Pristis pectinata]|uniref:V-set and immunoglobulin domain-containing protein 2-like isoform X2 n=1 Tax=Pristis pectinata TaxID=685728 RepID=UPI00223E0CC1|nr:V-set and immunoglobulin domain-containing protein 2-like isoform X2 [Pristis pectinata]
MLRRLTLIFSSILFTPYFDAVQSIYVTTSQPYVTVNIGNNATLDCSYKTRVGDQFSLEWRFTPGPNENVPAEKILYYTDGTAYKLGPQANRIKLVDQEPTKGDASIIILNTKSSDTGRYSCDINNPPDFTGPTEAFVNLIVQVPPSIPKCKVIGKPYIGNNITLSCISTVGRPTPMYKWSEVRSATATSSPRIMVKVDSKKGTLLLRNLTMKDSGIYRCVSFNVLGEKSCQLVLSVTVNNEVGVIVGALFGTLVALLLIAVVAYHLIHRKKKKSKDHHTGHELREDAVAPGKETNSHLLASAHNEGTRSNSMNSKYNIVV